MLSTFIECNLFCASHQHTAANWFITVCVHMCACIGFNHLFIILSTTKIRRVTMTCLVRLFQHALSYTKTDDHGSTALVV